MQCYEVGASDNIDSLRLVERPDPIPGPGQMVLDVKAASLNWRDLEIITGQFFFKKPPTRVPVSDGAGVVIAIGDGVTKFRIGDRVVCNHFSDWVSGPWSPDDYYPSDLGDNVDGFMADRAVVPAHCATKLPDSISFEEASTFPAAGVTAWRMINEMARVKACDTILTLGTGGVSVFTLQLAKLAGARVAITSSSDDKLDHMRRLGADITVNYVKTPDWEKEIIAQTEGLGVDYVFDHAGPVTMKKSMACCKPNGKVFMVGRTGGRAERQPNIVNAYRNNLSIHTLSAGPRIMLDDLVRAWGFHKMKPVIDRVFSFEDGIAAFKYLESGKHTGKVVIKIG